MILQTIQRECTRFLELADRKRRWSVFDDIPWDCLEGGQLAKGVDGLIELFCAEELYAPDYSRHGLALTRSMFGAAWFQLAWGYEESRHGLALREYLTRSGLRSREQMDAFELDLMSREWHLPFSTWRAMACYGALQEAATCLAYKAQRDKALENDDAVLSAIFAYLSRDEAAHAEFYRAVIRAELTEDRLGTLEDLAHVIASFQMPGDGLVAGYHQRLRDTGAGISTRVFVEHVLGATLHRIGTDRTEVRNAGRGRSLATIAGMTRIATA